MEDFKKRLLDEQSELFARVEKLGRFMSFSDEFRSLPEIDKKELEEQLMHMQGYLSVLDRRIGRLCVNA